MKLALMKLAASSKQQAASSKQQASTIKKKDKINQSFYKNKNIHINM
jgi:hypothetical protein